MIKLFIGKAGSGKDYLLKKELQEHMSTKRIVNYTTRPKRENEEDGVDYHFLTREEMLDLMNLNEVFSVYVHNGINSKGEREEWMYAAPKINKDIWPDKFNYCGITEPDGILDYIRQYGAENISVTYVNAPDETRKERYMGRDMFNEQEWERRLQSDSRSFSKEKLEKIKSKCESFVEVTNI